MKYAALDAWTSCKIALKLQTRKALETENLADLDPLITQKYSSPPLFLFLSSLHSPSHNVLKHYRLGLINKQQTLMTDIQKRKFTVPCSVKAIDDYSFQLNLHRYISFLQLNTIYVYLLLDMKSELEIGIIYTLVVGKTLGWLPRSTERPLW